MLTEAARSTQAPVCLPACGTHARGRISISSVRFELDFNPSRLAFAKFLEGFDACRKRFVLRDDFRGIDRAGRHLIDEVRL